MLSRDLEVISVYFRELLVNAPLHEVNIRLILASIEDMKKVSDFSFEASVLLGRLETDECSICKKRVYLNE